MKNFIKKLLGLDKLENEVREAKQAAEEMAKKVVETETKLAEATKSPKEIATENKEPWVAVLQTHVGQDNVRNGFFELDWNEYFVLQLRSAGYIGEDDEAVVDEWFTELCRNVGGEEGIDMTRRMSGSVTRTLRDDGKTEVS
jgi:hypothetical protein